MIKTSSVLRKKWFQITAATVGAVVVTGGAVGGGVAAGIIKVATERAEKKFAQAGITLDADSKSDIDLGKFTGTESKINVVSLGDSVTAGYTSLHYTSPTAGVLPKGKDANGNDIPPDVPSYADNVAKLLKTNGRLGSYDSLAVDGEKTTDMLEQITDLANRPILAKANLIFLTIGANDILQAVKLLGVPYSRFQNLLVDPFDAVKNQAAAVSGVATDPKGTGLTVNKTTVPNASYLPSLLGGVQNVLNNKAEATFSVDAPVLETQLQNAASNILKSLSFIHELAPGAKIVISEYQFPFNRLINADGVNITDIPQPELLKLTFAGDAIGKNTVRGVYDYVMDQLKTQTTEGFGVVTWNSLQENQDELVKQLSDDKTFTSQAAAVAAFQPDITDIHPSEYSHALVGQLIYNKYLVDTMKVPKSEEKYDNIKTAVLGATIDPQRTVIQLFFDFVVANTNSPDDTTHVFFNNLMTKVIAEMTDTLKQPDLSKIDLTSAATLTQLSTTASFNFLSAIFALSASPNPATQAAFAVATDAFINKFIFGSDTELYDLMIKDPNAFKSLDFDATSTTPVASIKKLMGGVVNEAVMSRLSPAQQDLALLSSLSNFVQRALALPAADKRSLEAAMPNLPANTFDTPATAAGAVVAWLQTTIPTLSDTQINAAPASIRDDLRNLVNALRTDLQAKVPFQAAATAIVALSDDEKTTLGEPFELDAAHSKSLFSSVPDTILFLAISLYSGSPASVAAIDDTYGAKGKTIITTLYNEVTKALNYANALATAYPMAFFTNYKTNQKTRALTLGDILFRATPTLSITIA